MSKATLILLCLLVGCGGDAFSAAAPDDAATDRSAAEPDDGGGPTSDTDVGRAADGANESDTQPNAQEDAPFVAEAADDRFAAADGVASDDAAVEAGVESEGGNSNDGRASDAAVEAAPTDAASDAPVETGPTDAAASDAPVETGPTDAARESASEGGGEACTPSIFYFDGDGDRYGGTTTFTGCEAPANGSWVRVGGDCDDSNSEVNPGQTAYFAHGYVPTGKSTTSFDYNCDGQETESGNSPKAGCYGGLNCMGSGYVAATPQRSGPGVDPFCGSDQAVTCALQALTCTAGPQQQVAPITCH
jgi:hypothetical protein